MKAISVSHYGVLLFLMKIKAQVPLYTDAASIRMTASVNPTAAILERMVSIDTI